MNALLDHLALGFGEALTWMNLGFCLAGCLIGTLVGVLPGLGPVATIAMLLPATYALPPVTALIMLAGIYYGAQYGGSTTAILLRLPGESSSVITCLDGNAMARNGRAGSALTVAALGSFFAGTVATLLLAALSSPLASVAQRFGPAELFLLMVLGLIAAVVLAQGSFVRSLAMILAGLLLGTVGGDVNSGVQRFTFGLGVLSDGLGFVPVAMGLFGVAEIIANLVRGDGGGGKVERIGSLWPTKAEAREAAPAVLRGTVVGSLLGILPGGGATLASFVAYTVEKKLAREPWRFGRGAVAGVAAPESANNAGAQTSFVPLLTLGLPANAVMAMMVGAMMMHGIAPGPGVIDSQPALVWGMVASMWVGNLMLVVINLPLIGWWVKLVSVPYRLLYPAVLVFCLVGVYSVNNSTAEVLLTALFGVVGWLLQRWRCDAAPLLLAFVLGPMLEENLRRALLLSRGNPAVFIDSPIAVALLALAVVLVIAVALPRVRRLRGVAFAE
ncbi:tripartite tricarboxylate transporter permease [Derxia gummosa]|uniref:Tripartite tricarboxylate transporter permease n=1 Tax=Derxia gummosa DSM 723 TaxID=1121388 RepID=A0A8B6X4R8_9BURK|nr:tripartite tricarboxylate transporter permease [Derxia gummosa]